MGNIDDISIDLPSRRDDEPQSLRTDIIDELTDHLECAFHRELHTQASGGRQATDSAPESAARARALSRFGNPSTIARRLWYDAMQERLMSQRIATAAAVVAAVACLGMFVFMWNSSAANREMLQQSQQMNAQLLAQMQGLAASLTAGRSEDDRPAEWNRVQVRCVADSEDGPPLAGVEVGMESASENTVGIPPATMTTDADGLADFGLVLYGQYSIDLKAPNGMRTQRQISVRPGIDTLETFVCPTGDGLAELQIEPRFEGHAAPPESDRIWYLVSLVRQGHASSLWSRPASDPNHPDVVRCFCGPHGELIAVDGQDFTATPPENRAGLFGPVTQSVWKLPEGAAPRESVRVEPGYYSFSEGAVCIMDDSDPSGRTLHQVLIPDLDSLRNTDEDVMVAWDRTNSLTFPVNTSTLAMLNRIDEAAPDLEVAELEVRMDGYMSISALRGGRGDAGESGLPFGSRLALSLNFHRRRSPEDPPPGPPLLTGVEVIADLDRQPLMMGFEYYNSTPGPARKLLVLLTPEEREFLGALPRLYATPVARDTARRSVAPALKEELLKALDSAAEESE